MKYCPMCGTPNNEEAQVCTNCGRPFAPAPTVAAPPQETPAAAPPQAQAAPPPVMPAPAQAAPVSYAPPPVTPPPQAGPVSYAPLPMQAAPPYSPPQTTLPIRMETLVAVLGFAAGALALLILIIVSVVGEDKSKTIVLVRSFTYSLIDLYILGLALYAGYNLVAHGLNLSTLFGKVPTWAKWLLVGISGYIIYASSTLVTRRLFQFVTNRTADTALLVEQLLEGLTVLIVAGIAYWRLSRRTIS